MILTRQLEQVIVINENIRVKVLGIDGRGVRLGIDAPADVPVDREEIFIAKQGGEIDGNR